MRPARKGIAAEGTDLGGTTRQTRECSVNLYGQGQNVFQRGIVGS